MRSSLPHFIIFDAFKVTLAHMYATVTVDPKVQNCAENSEARHHIDHAPSQEPSPVQLSTRPENVYDLESNPHGCRVGNERSPLSERPWSRPPLSLRANPRRAKDRQRVGDKEPGTGEVNEHSIYFGRVDEGERRGDNAGEDNCVVGKSLLLGQLDQETVCREYPISSARPNATRNRGLNGHKAGHESNEEQELESSRRTCAEVCLQDGCDRVKHLTGHHCTEVGNGHGQRKA